jgi:hypothetical protein
MVAKRCYSHKNQEAQMRFGTKLVAALTIVVAVLAQKSANALPYDPYPWCANYDGGKRLRGPKLRFLDLESMHGHRERHWGILRA